MLTPEPDLPASVRTSSSYTQESRPGLHFGALILQPQTVSLFCSLYRDVFFAKWVCMF